MTVDTQANKAVAARMFERFSAGDLAGVLDMLAEDVTWWRAGKGAIAEGDKVAMELTSLGRLKNGRTYNQEYHMLISVRDGKISAVREYLDTLHVQSVWNEP